MRDNRLVIAAVVLLSLLLLSLFNAYRWHLVDACHELGGIWDGSDSRCRLVPRIDVGGSSSATTAVDSEELTT